MVVQNNCLIIYSKFIFGEGQLELFKDYPLVKIFHEKMPFLKHFFTDSWDFLKFEKILQIFFDPLHQNCFLKYYPTPLEFLARPGSYLYECRVSSKTSSYLPTCYPLYAVVVQQSNITSWRVSFYPPNRQHMHIPVRILDKHPYRSRLYRFHVRKYLTTQNLHYGSIRSYIWSITFEGVEIQHSP